VKNRLIRFATCLVLAITALYRVDLPDNGTFAAMAAKMALFQSDTELRIYKGLYEIITIKNALNRIKSQSITGTAERYSQNCDQLATFYGQKSRESSTKADLSDMIREAQKILQKIRRLENVQAIGEMK